MTKHHIIVKRIYDKAEKTDGYRILVDRLWPRGITKNDASVDLWLKDISPTNELRKWFNHDPEKWSEFERKYADELKQKNECLSQLKHFLTKDNITLLYSAKDDEHNNAVALKKYLLTN